MSRTTNIFIGVITLLTVAVLVGGAYFIFLQPPNEVETAAIPTAAVLPTITPFPPTVTPFPTFPPTFTPIPSITPTFTLTPTLTLTVSLTPTITDTPDATATPVTTDTPVPTATATLTETPNFPSATPTVTRSPFPFAVRGGQAVFTQNTYNSQGCAFQAVSGQVLDEQNGGLNGIEVFVTEAGGSERASVSGSNTLYGPGGYEVVVDNQISGRTYTVQLRTTAGTELSQPYTLTFPSNCDQNVALIYWSQTRPF